DEPHSPELIRAPFLRHPELEHCPADEVTKRFVELHGLARETRAELFERRLETSVTHCVRRETRQEMHEPGDFLRELVVPRLQHLVFVAKGPAEGGEASVLLVPGAELDDDRGHPRPEMLGCFRRLEG